jgi:hypothetical protein
MLKSIDMPAALLQANRSTTDVGKSALSGSVLARFLELRGRRIIRACGALWYTVPGRFLMSLPYQRMLDPDPSELRRMVRDSACFGARFPSDAWTGLESGLYVMRPRPYDIKSLHIKHRPRVRHAIERFEVRPSEKAELLQQGCVLNRSTMARQGRYDPEFGDPRRWQRFVEAVFACPGVSAPAVFAGSRLAAYMITCHEDRWLHILHQMSRQEDLPDFPNHLLTYSVTSLAAADPALDAVCYGYLPLFSADGLHEYKLRFGYEMIPHHSAIQLHPTLHAVAKRPLTHAAVSFTRRLRQNNQHLETIETVLKGARLSGRP